MGDIRWFNLSECSLRAPFGEAGRIDVVVHAAASYGRSGEASSEVQKTNTLFPLELLETAASFRCPLFVNMDTYFHKEQEVFSYVTNYSISKKHFVDWARCLAPLTGIRVVNLKLEHLYGPYDHEAKFTTSIAGACLRNERSLRLTKGEQRRDFVYVEDAVSALCLIVNGDLKEPGFEGHEIGTGATISIRQFVEFVHTAAQSTTELLFGELPYREGEIMHSVADNASLSRLGWRVKTSLREGIDRLLRSMRPKAQLESANPY